MNSWTCAFKNLEAVKLRAHVKVLVHFRYILKFHLNIPIYLHVEYAIIIVNICAKLQKTKI